jgi:methyl-accepting chemotaxis protein
VCIYFPEVKNLMKNIKVSIKIGVLILVACIAAALSAFLTRSQMKNVAIGGEIDNNITLAAVLEADILPPPAFIIESYAIAMEYCVITDQANRDEIIANMIKRQEDFVEREKYWIDNVPDYASLPTVFVKEAFAAGNQFYDDFFNGLVVAETPAEEQAAILKLKEDYLVHRKAIDTTVIDARGYSADQTGIASAMEERTNIIINIIVGVCIVFFLAFGLFVAYTIISTLDYANITIGKIAMGNLDIEIDENRISKDEPGQIIGSLQRVAALLKRINNYIMEISGGLTEYSKGNVDVDLKEDYVGDFAAIKDSFNKFQAMLKTTMTEISDATKTVELQSTQINGISMNLTQSATHQAATVEEISAAISDVAMKTYANSEMAQAASRLSGEVMSNAEKGSVQMSEMNDAVAEIDRASQDIKKIIKVIDGIAFQTNILALNASVEAARAGEAGKGFVVVADEVRSLASRSAAAAKETGILIENSMLKASLGAKLATATAESLHEIVKGIDKSSELIGKIAQGSEEQSNAIKQINTAIDQVNEAVQGNSATSEEAAATSQELDRQTHLLSENVAKFQIATI